MSFFPFIDPLLEELKKQVVPASKKSSSEQKTSTVNINQNTLQITKTVSSTITASESYEEQETFIRPNGVTVFVVDELPEKYRREPISQEEIEFIEVTNWFTE